MTPAVLLTFTLVVVAASGRLTLAGSCVRQDSDDKVRTFICTKDPSQPVVTIEGITDVEDAGLFEVCCAKKLQRCKRPRPWKRAKVLAQDGDTVTVYTAACRKEKPAQALRWGCHSSECEGCNLGGKLQIPILDSPDRR